MTSNPLFQRYFVQYNKFKKQITLVNQGEKVFWVKIVKVYRARKKFLLQPLVAFSSFVIKM